MNHATALPPTPIISLSAKVHISLGILVCICLFTSSYSDWNRKLWLSPEIYIVSKIWLHVFLHDMLVAIAHAKDWIPFRMSLPVFLCDFQLCYVLMLFIRFFLKLRSDFWTKNKSQQESIEKYMIHWFVKIGAIISLILNYINNFGQFVLKFGQVLSKYSSPMC